MAEALQELAKQTLSSVASFRDSVLKDVDPMHEEYGTYLDVFYSQVGELESVLTLCGDQKYRECFVLLRSVLESHFFLLLMIRGKRYRRYEPYVIIPNLGHAPEEARDLTLDRWKILKKQGNPNYVHVVDMQRLKKNGIMVISELEGLYFQGDTQKTGPVIPWYYFVYSEFSPASAFVESLPSIKESEPYADVYGDVTSTISKRQKQLYSHYLHFDSVTRNLLLNDLLSVEQVDQLRAHYSFLSSFVHPTKYSNSVLPIGLRDEAAEELILLYVCKLLAMSIELIVDYFRGVNVSERYSPYLTQVNKLRDSTNYFPFISQKLERQACLDPLAYIRRTRRTRHS
jgi:hypothetical protein